MLIDAFVVFYRLHGPFEAISYEVTFGRWPFREEKETRRGLQLGVNLVASTRDLFHFKLELTPNWS